DAEAVAVMRDTAHHAAHDAAVMLGFRRAGDRTETKRVHDGDGTRAHCEDIAQNAADTRGRALKRLNVARVIVRFDLERHHPTAADADDAGVFAGPLHHVLPLRGQLFQVNARALIRTMLAPHHAEDAEFGIARFAPEQGYDFLVFRGGELMLFDQLRCDCHLARAGTALRTDSKIPRPSVEPISGSQARSGCGIMPRTLRPSLRIPAISRAEPLGFSTYR